MSCLPAALMRVDTSVLQVFSREIMFYMHGGRLDVVAITLLQLSIVPVKR